MYIMGHNSLLCGQAAVSQRNNHMVNWWPIIGGGNDSYFITNARLSLLRDCPGEDGPLLSGDLTAPGVLYSSFSRIMLHPVHDQIITEGGVTDRLESLLLSLFLAHSNTPSGKKLWMGV